MQIHKMNKIQFNRSKQRAVTWKARENIFFILFKWFTVAQ